MFDNMKNIAEAAIEAAALRDERIRLCKEVVSKTDFTCLLYTSPSPRD